MVLVTLFDISQLVTLFFIHNWWPQLYLENDWSWLLLVASCTFPNGLTCDLIIIELMMIPQKHDKIYTYMIKYAKKRHRITIISKQSITGFWSFWQKSWHAAIWANLNKDNLWHWWVLFNFFCWSCFFLYFLFFSVPGCFFNFLLGGRFSFMCAPWYACCSVSWLIVYHCACFAHWNGKRGGTCFTAAVMETFNWTLPF